MGIRILIVPVMWIRILLFIRPSMSIFLATLLRASAVHHGSILSLHSSSFFYFYSEPDFDFDADPDPALNMMQIHADLDL